MLIEKTDVRALAHENGLTPFSFSQVNLYTKCPLSWKLKYIDKIRDLERGSLPAIFGNAMHTTIQHYLKVFYNESSIVANEIDLVQLFKEQFIIEFKLVSEKLGTKDFATSIDMLEFFNDAVEILDFFRKNRHKYFQKVGFKLIGVEVPLVVPTDLNKNIGFIGYLDIVLSDKNGNIYIKDLKTSISSWSDKKKKDLSTNAQLLLYKKYYAKQYNVDIKKIDVEFVILKRKVYNVGLYPTGRIQIHMPASGLPSIKKAEGLLNEALIHIFDVEGKPYEIDHPYADDIKKCKYCDYFKTSYCTRPTKKKKDV